MVKIIEPPRPRDPRLEAVSAEAIRTSDGRARNAIAGEALDAPGSFNSVRRYVEDSTSGIGDVFDALAATPEEADAANARAFADTRITAEDANARYGIKGRLSFTDALIPEHVAAERNLRARRAMLREELIANGDGDIVPILPRFAERFAIGFAAQAVDPVNLATLAISPELIFGKEAVLGARLGTRIAQGALTAGGTQVGIEALASAAAGNDGVDYHFGDALANVLFSAVLGGAAHGVFGAAPRESASANVPRETSPTAAGARTDAPPLTQGAAGGEADAFRAALAPEAAAITEPDDVARALEAEAQRTALARTVSDPIDARAQYARGEGLLTALDGAAKGETVDVGPAFERALVERRAAAGRIGPRIAVDDIGPSRVETPSGLVREARLAVAELDDLIASRSPDGALNRAYPDALPPAAERAPSLIGAAEGSPAERAPVIARDGVIEAGEADYHSLRAAYDAGGAEDYRAQLRAAGVAVDRFERPVLVRVVRHASGDERLQFRAAAVQDEATALRAQSTEPGRAQLSPDQQPDAPAQSTAQSPPAPDTSSSRDPAPEAAAALQANAEAPQVELPSKDVALGARPEEPEARLAAIMSDQARLSGDIDDLSEELRQLADQGLITADELDAALAPPAMTADHLKAAFDAAANCLLGRGVI